MKDLLIQEIKLMGIKDKSVLEAISSIKRELFVPEDLVDEAYKNYPLPIGHGQTISQPYTVAFMIELLNIQPSDKILEIGAGSGYNAAVMSKLARKIITVELENDLCKFAKRNLEKAGIKNVTVINGNGYYGYEKDSPYDKIIVTAAPKNIPETLLNQLKDKGILVIPITKGFSEKMTRIVRDSKLSITYHGDFAFVPLRKNYK